MKGFLISYDESKQCLHFAVQQRMTSDEVLNYFSLGRRQRYFYYHNHLITRNKQVITQSCECLPGDLLSIDLAHEIILKIPPWQQDLPIVYEDALCLIVNKASGILVHSDGVNQSHTLHNIVQAYYDRKQINSSVRAVHRLDKDTSGLLFYCKMPFFQAYFDSLLQTKQISRSYLAWVEGIVKQPLRIDQKIGRDRHNAKKMRVSSSGQSAVTHVIPLCCHRNCTLVECRLESGRTHQIRVHLAYMQHPLLNDPLYAFKQANTGRLALHAWKLRFYHPLETKTLTVSCLPPKDMPYYEIVLQALSQQ